MPAVNVAKTDTFETQRQKINQIGTQIFSISGGGSDLSTGLLLLGDGSKTNPSLAYETDTSLGMFKPQAKSIGFVSGTKRILDIRETAFVTFKDILVQNKSLQTSGTSISNPGTGYDVGTFSNVPFDGGTGFFGTADIVVTEYLGTVTQEGIDYISGDFTANLTGGNGSGATVSFSVTGLSLAIQNPGAQLVEAVYSVPLSGGQGSGAEADVGVVGPTTITGTITNGGSGYADGSYADTPLTGGSGPNTDILGTVDISGGVVTQVAITFPGTGYQVGDILGVDDANVGGGGGSNFAFRIDTVDITGVVTTITITNEGQGYRNGDTLSVPASSLGNASGTAPQFQVTSFPGGIEGLTFDSKGTGYQTNDVLALPGPLTGISTNLSSQLQATANVTSGSTTITLASTTGILQGMTVNGGEVLEGTTVASVTNSTTIELSQAAAATNATATLDFASDVNNLDEITVADTSNISVGFLVSQTAGTGVLGTGVTVQTIVDGTTLQLSAVPTQAGTATLTLTPGYGVPTQNFEYTVGALGAVESLTINAGGSGYDPGDVLTVAATDLVNAISFPVLVEDIETLVPVETIPVSSGLAPTVGGTIDFVGDAGTTTLDVIAINSSGGNITDITVLGVSGAQAQSSWNPTGVGVSYTVSSITSSFRFNIDGSGDWNGTLLYSGNTYLWDLSDSSLAGHVFALSEFKDGTRNITTVNATITPGSTTLSIVESLSGSNVAVGMEVTTVSDGGGSTAAGTKIISIDTGANTITVDNLPVNGGAAQLEIAGVEYLTGVTRSVEGLELEVTDTTPSPLYVYCPNHALMGSSPGSTGDNTYTIDLNNPKVFGSGAEFTLITIAESTLISADVETGTLDTFNSTGTNLTFTSGNINNLTAPTAKSTFFTVDEIRADSNGVNKIDVFAGAEINIKGGNFNIGNQIQIANTSGDIATTGEIKTTGTVNVNDRLSITNNVISTNPGFDLEFSPPSTGQTRINSSSALVIPSGNIAERPIQAVSYDGAIRFNTETQQYEGYSSQTTSWTSLGGVRDTDGNTQILAELTVGANDNTLWFYNDGDNTIKVTKNHLEFVEVKKIRSANTAAPAYTEWVANSPVTQGAYVKYRNDIYEVITGGLTGTTGNEPNDQSGNTFANGSAELAYSTTAVANLIFEEIGEIRIDPLGFTDLVINNDLRLGDNKISTDINDLILQPNAGQKIVCNIPTSLVIPVGDNNSKGNPVQGSIRYNTDDNQFEGYNGNQWGGLGGVKDVDQDTEIKAESAAGADEDTLFFINQNLSSLRLTSAELNFDNVDTLVSTISDTFNLNASTITFDTLATSLDNTSTTETFLYSTKDNFDFGMSAGLTVDPVLRITNNADVFFNLGYGTGTFSGVRLLDEALQDVQLNNFRILTKKSDLERGTLNTGDAVLFDPLTETACTARIVANNITTGDREFVEYAVTSKGTDIFHTEVSNVSTGVNLFNTAFDFTAGGEVRITYTLDANLSTGDDVEITVVSQIIKK